MAPFSGALHERLGVRTVLLSGMAVCVAALMLLSMALTGMGARIHSVMISLAVGPLFFANALYFRNEVRLLLSGSTPPKAILVNLHANFGIDLSATDTLLGLVAEAEKINTEVMFAELQDPVRQMFRRCGLLDRVGENHIFPTVDDAVQEYLNRHTAAPYASVAAGSG